MREVMTVYDSMEKPPAGVRKGNIQSRTRIVRKV